MIKTIICNLTFFLLKIFSKPLKQDVIEQQYIHNRKLWKQSAYSGYIDSQNNMSDYYYGTASVIVRKLFFKGQNMNAGDNSCEVIAAYNAIVATDTMEDIYQFPELLRRFSGDGIVLKGAFGTNPIKIRSFFEEKYEVEELRGKNIKPDKVEELAKNFETFIFCSFNKGYNPFSMMHTMCIEKKDKETYKIHNDYEGNKIYPSLFEAVTGYNSGKGDTTYILGIKKRKNM